MSRKILFGAIASLALLAAFAMPSVSEARGPRTGNVAVRHVRHRNNQFQRGHRARTARHYRTSGYHGRTYSWRGNAYHTRGNHYYHRGVR